MRENIIVMVGGRSGVGKTSIIDFLVKNQGERYARPLSYTSRLKRNGEGCEEYNFISEEKMILMRDEGRFLNFDCVYGNYYAIAKKSIDVINTEGKVPIKEIHPSNQAKIKLCYPNAVSVLIKEIGVNGSRKESAWLTARPEFRLQNVTRDEFARYINELSERGISFNYTLNTSYLGNKEQIIKREEEIQEYISFLIEAGVKTITVSLPYMAEIIRRVSDKIGIEVSTIAHLDSLTQIKIWQELYGITKICIGLNKNRDINFLSAAARYCNEHDIVLTLLANEFCGNGITESDEIKGATGCIFRDHCYQLHSAGYQKETKLHKDYPMGMCIASRKSKSVWLKMNYIRPEDIKRYNEIGIDHFKLTGRTGSTAHLQEIMRAYMKESYDGNLLGLWKHLETIKEEKEESFRPQVYIDNKKLDGFVDYWFENRNHICANEICGETCKYCDLFIKRANI